MNLKHVAARELSRIDERDLFYLRFLHGYWKAWKKGQLDLEENLVLALEFQRILDEGLSGDSPRALLSRLDKALEDPDKYHKHNLREWALMAILVLDEPITWRGIKVCVEY